MEGRSCSRAASCCTEQRAALLQGGGRSSDHAAMRVRDVQEHGSAGVSRRPRTIPLAGISAQPSSCTQGYTILKLGLLVLEIIPPVK